MDTLGSIKGVLIFQVSLYNEAALFGAITKCVDYTGVLINGFLLFKIIQSGVPD